MFAQVQETSHSIVPNAITHVVQAHEQAVSDKAAAWHSQAADQAKQKCCTDILGWSC